MGRVVRFVSPRVVSLAEEDEPALGQNEARVATLFSGISAGTQALPTGGLTRTCRRDGTPAGRLSVAEGSAPAGTAMPGNDGRGNPGRAEYPVGGMGYEEVGNVVEIGRDVEGLEVGVGAE